MSLFLTFSGVSLILAGIGYLLFPHVGVGLAGVELPVASAAIDVRATYGGTQVGAGLFLLWCRRKNGTARVGLVLILVWSVCLMLSRIYGFAVDGGPGWFNALGIAVEGAFVVVAALLLQRSAVRPVRGNSSGQRADERRQEAVHLRTRTPGELHLRDHVARADHDARAVPRRGGV